MVDLRSTTATKIDDRSEHPIVPARTTSAGHATVENRFGAIDTADQLKAVLQQMDPYDVEQFVADLWERIGWEPTEFVEVFWL